MSKIPYSKSPTTHSEQIEKLRSRGMIIDDEALALSTLQHVNYYRLVAYWLPFEEEHATHVFKDKVKFTDALTLYNFDRELRLVVLDAIERFEVSIRTQWTYHLSHAYGAHAHLNPKIHRSDWWTKNIDDLTKEVNRSDEVFIEHLTSKYKESLPPIWAVSEIMSAGLLSRWLKSIHVIRIKKDIAAAYTLPQEVLISWLHHVSVVRNVCAHHGRLWSRDFSRIAPMVPEKLAVGKLFVGGHPIYNTFVILAYLTDIIAAGDSWKDKLVALIKKYPAIQASDMGFPADWQTLKMWK